MERGQCYALHPSTLAEVTVLVNHASTPSICQPAGLLLGWANGTWQSQHYGALQLMMKIPHMLLSKAVVIGLLRMEKVSLQVFGSQLSSCPWE